MILSVINVQVADSGMGSMGKRRFCAFCVSMLLSSTTWAATIQPGQGDLSLNQGKGFQPINSRIDANVGDTVMVGPGGSATVVYDDGCKVDVKPGAVTTIAPLSPCASGSNAQDPNSYWAPVGFIAVVGAVTGVVVYEGTKSANNGSAPSAASP
jgi:hypothetical protein